MRAVNKIDKLAYGMLLIGALNSSLTGLTQKSFVKKMGGRSSMGMKLFYGLLGAATTYNIARLIAPKTREEQRMLKMAEIYDQAESYRHKADQYMHKADSLVKQLKRRYRDAKKIRQH